VCYISKAIHEDMVCERHPDGCGRFLNPGDIIFIDASQCRFYRCTWYVSCRKLNSDGCRTCKVGYVKVLADMMHLVGNRIGVITSIHVHDIDHTEIRSKTKVITKYDKEKPVTQQPETKKSKSSNAKPKSTTAQKKHTSGKTLDLCSCVHDYALITLLDGGVPSFGDIGNHPLAQQGGGGDNDDDDDDDDGESDDVDTISSLESVERKPAAKKKPTKESKKSAGVKRKKGQKQK
jgi:hypothetical protein